MSPYLTPDLWPRVIGLGIPPREPNPLAWLVSRAEALAVAHREWSARWYKMDGHLRALWACSVDHDATVADLRAMIAQMRVEHAAAMQADPPPPDVEMSPAGQIAILRDQLTAEKRRAAHLTAEMWDMSRVAERSGEYCDRLRAEAAELRATLAAEQSRTGRPWFVVHSADGDLLTEVFDGVGAEQAAKLTARARSATWSTVYIGTACEVRSDDFGAEAHMERATLAAHDKATP